MDFWLRSISFGVTWKLNWIFSVMAPRKIGCLSFKIQLIELAHSLFPTSHSRWFQKCLLNLSRILLFHYSVFLIELFNWLENHQQSLIVLLVLIFWRIWSARLQLQNGNEREFDGTHVKSQSLFVVMSSRSNIFCLRTFYPAGLVCRPLDYFLTSFQTSNS